ncbi:MAG: DevR family CRISPR-associated autoregulator, partial [Anaerolineae bacterium]|nr:DevR family CRISPR-associated autoregulator [Anaerolineae bacterium]
MATQSIYSLSISGRAILDMHSLNNEGGEGNQITTRMVTIVHKPDGKPTLTTVNAISGDMFKHIQSEHLHRLALREGLPLSEGARLFNANRINYDLAKN